ncbi:hypothetical protein CYMTET_41004 [Cymbomonas tetramitiformis]|uniref:Uncharacterized protein n=1 Tax=Cymbomonas tetramitiformis TaxID=36881 RepID=A0AAE0C887_9CHLO|nr:hypothetical protein CYMTET_41004 [Cymbomonas tetramitiformis]
MRTKRSREGCLPDLSVSAFISAEGSKKACAVVAARIRASLFAKAVSVLHDYRVDGERIVSSIDVRCLALVSHEMRRVLQKGQAKAPTLSDLRALVQSYREEAEIRKDIERALFLYCDPQTLAKHFVDTDVSAPLWKFAIPVTAGVVKYAMREKKGATARALCDLHAVFRNHNKDVTFMTSAVESGDVSLVHHLHAQRWHHSVKDVCHAIVPNVAMLRWVCEHILHDDGVGRFSCSANCYGRMGNVEELERLYHEVLNRGLEHYFTQNPSIRILQMAAMGNHIHVLHWILVDTEYDIDDELVLTEAYDTAVNEGHFEFVLELDAQVPFFLRGNASIVQRLKARTKNPQIASWLCALC